MEETTPSSDHEMEDDTAANGDGDVAVAVDDDHDESPAFIHPDDADAEVVDVDLVHEPMDDDDDDDGCENRNVMADADSDAAAAPADAATRVVDTADAVIEAHDGPVYAVAVVASSAGGGDGSTATLRIASGGGDDRAFLTSYRVGGGRGSGGTDSTKRTTAASIELSVASHRNTDTVSCVAFNFGTPEMLATGCYDGTIQLWDVSAGQQPRHVRQLDGPTDVEWLSFHPNGGTVLLAGSTDGTTWMYHVPSGKCLQVFVGHEDDVSAGSFTSDGKFAVTAGADGTLRVWAPRKGTCRHAFRNSGGGGGEQVGFAEGALTCLAVGGGTDGQLGMVGGVDGSAYVVHFGNKRVLSRLRHHDDDTGVGAGGTAMRDDDDEDDGEARSVEAVGFAPTGVNPNWCATGGVDGTLKVWDLTTGQCRHVCRHVCRHESPAPSSGTTDGVGVGGVLGGVTRLAWHPTRPLIYTSASDGLVRLWDARSGRLVRSWTGHTDVINDMHVIFGIIDDDGNENERSGATSSSPNDGAESSSVDVVVTGSDDGTVRVFEVDVEGCVAGAAAAADVASAATSGM